VCLVFHGQLPRIPPEHTKRGARARRRSRLVGLLLVARRVDALTLGDDAARGQGVPVRATRVTVVVLAALLSAAAVTLAGPIGFVSLFTPALVRPLARRFRGFVHARAVLPAAGLAGAVFLVVTALRLRDTAWADAPDRLRIPSRTAFLVTVAALVAVVAGVALAGVLLGDVANWVQGRAGQTVSFVTIGFVGLMAPRAARALVGRRHVLVVLVRDRRAT
jgi:iron complex transport system permease protein